MNKQEALRIIFDCARVYNKELVNRNLLFAVSANGVNVSFFETVFLKVIIGT